jgi:hypothetical protein
MTLLRIYRLALVLITVALVAASVYGWREHQKSQLYLQTLNDTRKELANSKESLNVETHLAREWETTARQLSRHDLELVPGVIDPHYKAKAK